MKQGTLFKSAPEQDWMLDTELELPLTAYRSPLYTY